MKRVPEPELMDDPHQAKAYALADFSEPHDHFVSLFKGRFPRHLTGTVLDLGCGPGDICRRFAHAFPDCRIHGIDASEPMLTLGNDANRMQRLADRIELFRAYLPDADLPHDHYATIISNSLLHHLRHADTLWKTIRRFGRINSNIFVMDLLRPASTDKAAKLVENYAADEPEVLKQDFYNSLLAAYRPDEVEAQLKAHDLSELSLEIVSDRHFIVWGQVTR